MGYWFDTNDFVRLCSTFAYLMVGFPIVAAFILIKTGKLDDDDILLPSTIGGWFMDMYGGLLNKIK